MARKGCAERECGRSLWLSGGGVFQAEGRVHTKALGPDLARSAAGSPRRQTCLEGRKRGSKELEMNSTGQGGWW